MIFASTDLSSCAVNCCHFSDSMIRKQTHEMSKFDRVGFPRVIILSSTILLTTVRTSFVHRLDSSSSLRGIFWSTDVLDVSSDFGFSLLLSFSSAPASPVTWLWLVVSRFSSWLECWGMFCDLHGSTGNPRHCVSSFSCGQHLECPKSP